MELVKYLFTQPEVKSLSQHICQVPLENFLAASNDVEFMTTQMFRSLQKTQALRVINSFCQRPARGNCRGGWGESTSYTCKENIHEPLPKRPGDHSILASPSDYVRSNNYNIIKIYIIIILYMHLLSSFNNTIIISLNPYLNYLILNLNWK